MVVDSNKEMTNLFLVVNVVDVVVKDAVEVVVVEAAVVYNDVFVMGTISKVVDSNMGTENEVVDDVIGHKLVSEFSFSQNLSFEIEPFRNL